MPRLFMAVRMEDRTPIVDILEQTPPIPETSQWALFLRNHDELTLEMVTDEERDYMYRMYAHVHQARLNLGIRRRLAPLLGNDRKRIELLNGLLLSLPGTPVLYYGDEIGMGDNIYLGDRNGVRTPMQWSADRNAGFSRANPQQLYLPITLDPEYHYEAVNVEAQLRNPHSLLWWMRRVLALRKGWRALGEGRVEFLAPQNRKVLAYVLRYEQETLLVVANLSRFPQPVELDLSAFKDRVPVELFGRTPFPAIGELPFFLTPGPHGFYWFSLEPQPAAAARTGQRAPEARAALSVGRHWEEVLSERLAPALERAFSPYLRAVSWFAPRREAHQGGHAAGGGGAAAGVRQGLPDPLAGGICRRGSGVVCGAAGLRRGRRSRALAPRRAPARDGRGDDRGGPGRRGVLYDALGLREFDVALLEVIARRRRLKGRAGNVVAWRGPLLRALSRRATAALESAPLKDQAAAHFGPVRRAVRIEAVPPAALGHQSRAGAGAFPDRAVVPPCAAPGGSAGISSGRWGASEPGGGARLGGQGGERLGIHVARPGSVLRAGAVAARRKAGSFRRCRQAADSTRPAGVPG